MDLNKYIGIPYKRHGETREGIDCWGLVCLFYKEQYGIELPPYNDVLTDKKVEMFKGRFDNNNHLYSLFEKTDAPEFGDITQFNICGVPVHVGIYLNKREFLHAKENFSTMKAKYRDWENRIEGHYRYKG